jgi:hypothetical protein
MMKAVLLALFLSLICSSAVAETFAVTTLRASPGKLETLVDAVREYRASQKGRVILMRHSQGDHWDLMLLEPAPSGSVADFGDLADFQLSFLADGESSFDVLASQSDASNLYHIEMFHALAGKRATLVDQRERENQYLAATGQTANHVFVTRLGSDVDVFTLGFHEDWSAFIAGPTVTDEEAEKAARRAGFKNRADLGYFLRSLLTRHQDTLAVSVD